jgi:hypothetical protein
LKINLSIYLIALALTYLQSFFLVSPHGQNSQNSPFISQSSTEGAPFPTTHSSHLDVQPTALINHHDGSQDIPWCPDPLDNVLDFPQNVTIQNGQVESSVITSEDHARKTDLQWVDGLISEMDPDWNELPNVNVSDPEQKVCSSCQSDCCTYLP